MADFEAKLRWLSERGRPVGADELIERIQAGLADDPPVVVPERRQGAFMTSTSKPPTSGRPDRRRGPAWALAAFAVALAVGGFMYLVTRGDGPVADTTTTTTTVATFTEIAPGQKVGIPPAPLDWRGDPAAVWTGTELIVWGGYRDDAKVGDGAAFDLATGTWRVIAPSPLSPRQAPAFAWTGTEMLVWGGFAEHDTEPYDGAAYDPASDTWRLLPPSPLHRDHSGALMSMVWTGSEAVLLDAQGAAAYDPVTNSWRSLEHPPGAFYPATWSGDSIVVTDATLLVRYDPVTDTMATADIGSTEALVAVPGPDGLVTGYVNLPRETGAPVLLLDRTGALVSELPAFPGDASLFGDRLGASGLWLGDEAIFEIWNGTFPYPNGQVWALNPTTETWSRLSDAFLDHDALVVAGDLLFVYNSTGGTSNGWIYRAEGPSQG
jgi:hypothetical protein